MTTQDSVRRLAATDDLLSIGRLADATGVAVGTLRMWEARHGFPTSERTDAGHRRYRPGQVALVREVVRRRDAGSRLEAAIEAVQVSSVAAASSGSVYATLARDFPSQPRQRYRKSTLLAMSWAIEDELAATATHGHLFGAFQRASNFQSARVRWEELGRTSSTAIALAADFDASRADESEHVNCVRVPASSPMQREWAVVNDSAQLPVALTAWEVPGQSRSHDGDGDGDRLFESAWTVDPRAVRAAARVCSDVAAQAGNATAADLLAGPLAQEPSSVPDLLIVTRLVHRMIAYVEAAGRPVGR